MKKNLIWIILGVLGILTFCFFNFPYLSTHSGKYSSSIDGYAVLGKWADGALGGICAFLQLLIWCVSAFIILFALIKFLGEILGKPVPESFCGVSIKGLGELGLLVHGIFSLLLLFFAIIHTVNLSGNGVKYAVNIGLILSVCLSVSFNIFYFIKTKLNN